jgi:hypothetical protein
MAAAWFGTGAAIEDVYLDVTVRQIVGLEAAITMPRAWQSFLSAPSATEFLATRDGLRLQHAILAESAQWDAGAPTLYAPDGRMLFAPEVALIDTHPRDAEVRKVALTAEPLKLALPEEKLYGMDEELESNAIPVHVHYLRRKVLERLECIRMPQTVCDLRRPALSRPLLMLLVMPIASGFSL